MQVSFNNWQLLGLIVLSALLWMYYVDHKDRHQPEPRWRLAMAFGLGIIANPLSLLGYALLARLGVPDIMFNERPWTAVYCFGIVGPVEEGAKVLVACLLAFRWREFDEPMDGFVYAAAIALGYASAENLYTLPGTAWLLQLAYVVVLPIVHVLFSGIWGFGFGYARFCVSSRRERAFWQLGSVFLAMLLHGLYDFLTYAYEATLLTAGVALMLWSYVVWRTGLWRKEALARQVANGEK